MSFRVPKQGARVGMNQTGHVAPTILGSQKPSFHRSRVTQSLTPSTFTATLGSVVELINDFFECE